MTKKRSEPDLVYSKTSSLFFFFSCDSASPPASRAHRKLTCQKVEMLGTQQWSACSLLLDAAMGKLRFTETFIELCIA